jgi:O-acetyl-ADP-ribose deacetylase (regulator of RNase III)
MVVETTRIVLKRGDITCEKVDAIVNAANSGLLGGGGVDGAIHRAGGPTILAECRAIREKKGPCATGHAVITGAGHLEADHVIHAVGPRWTGGEQNEARLLAGAYQASLRLAAESGAKTIAFPSISTGAYGFPVKQAAPIALRVCRDFARENPGLREIRFVLFSEADLRVYREALERLVGQKC